MGFTVSLLVGRKGCQDDRLLSARVREKRTGRVGIDFNTGICLIGLSCEELIPVG